MGVITDLGERGAKPYAQVRDDVIEQVFEAKCAHLHGLDLDRATVADFNSARMLHVQCVHDTMNATVGPDGAVDHDKPEADWLPRIVSLGNRGDERGEPRPPAAGGALPLVDVPIIDAAQFRSLQQALAFAFEVPHEELDDALALNSPYLGAFECQQIGRLLRTLEPQGIVRHGSQEKVLSIRTGAYQAEFLRETLMGPTNVDHVRQPGTDWPETDHEHHVDLTRKAQDGIRHPPALGLRRAAHEGLRAAALPLSDGSRRSFGALPAVDDREPPSHSLACRDDGRPTERPCPPGRVDLGRPAGRPRRRGGQDVAAHPRRPRRPQHAALVSRPPLRHPRPDDRPPRWRLEAARRPRHPPLRARPRAGRARGGPPPGARDPRQGPRAQGGARHRGRLPRHRHGHVVGAARRPPAGRAGAAAGLRAARRRRRPGRLRDRPRARGRVQPRAARVPPLRAGHRDRRGRARRPRRRRQRLRPLSRVCRSRP